MLFRVNASTMRTIISLFIGIFLGFVLTTIAYWIFFSNDSFDLQKSTAQQCQYASEDQYIETREEGYKLIKPLLECDVNWQFDSVSSIKDEITEFLRDTEILDQSSVYYRNMNTGAWFGIREQQPINSASMSKVLLAAAMYEIAEKEPGFLDQKFVYTDEFESYHNLPTEQGNMQKGDEYTYAQLIERMLHFSDNEASRSLIKILEEYSPGKLSEYQERFGFDDGGQVSLFHYSNLFRMLYNATLLSREHSAQLLGILSNADFQDGIVKPIPEDIVVAHKFGFFDPQSMQDVMVFSHCGLFYTEPNPYLLCVSIRANDPTREAFWEAVAYSESLSELVYTASVR